MDSKTPDTSSEYSVNASLTVQAVKTAWAAGLALLDALERDRRRNVAGDAVIGAARAQAVTTVVFIGLVLTRKLAFVNFPSLDLPFQNAESDLSIRISKINMCSCSFNVNNCQ